MALGTGAGCVIVCVRVTVSCISLASPNAPSAGQSVGTVGIPFIAETEEASVMKVAAETKLRCFMISTFQWAGRWGPLRSDEIEVRPPLWLTQGQLNAFRKQDGSTDSK